MHGCGFRAGLLHVHTLARLCFLSWLVTLQLCTLAHAVQSDWRLPQTGIVHVEVDSGGSLQASAVQGSLDAPSLLHQKATDADQKKQPDILRDPEVKWPKGKFSLQSVQNSNLCLEVESDCQPVSCNACNSNYTASAIETPSSRRQRAIEAGNESSLTPAAAGNEISESSLGPASQCSCTELSEKQNAAGKCRLKFAECNGKEAQVFRFLDDYRKELVTIVPRNSKEAKRIGPAMYPQRCISESNAEQPVPPCDEKESTGSMAIQTKFFFDYLPGLSLRLQSKRTEWCLNIADVSSETWYGGSDIFTPCGEGGDANLWTLFPLPSPQEGSATGEPSD